MYSIKGLISNNWYQSLVRAVLRVAFREGGALAPLAGCYDDDTGRRTRKEKRSNDTVWTEFWFHEFSRGHVHGHISKNIFESECHRIIFLQISIAI
ncbi:hypothetical protein Hdeb2414_s0008g00296841 [Helianthus debilis subsp. tardiflorus]